MKTSQSIWSVFAAAVISAGCLTLTQFALTQEAPPEKTDAAGKKDIQPKGNQAAKTPEQKRVSTFMRMKLDASQKILEGLAVEDFKLIQEGAATLEEMSAAEKWRVTNDPLFREQSKDFQRVVTRLLKNAEEEKLEGAALSWMETTMRCIECHKWARAHLIADRAHP